MGDWRAFRAKLVADSGSGNWAARMAQANLQLLQMQARAAVRWRGGCLQAGWGSAGCRR